IRNRLFNRREPSPSRAVEWPPCPVDRRPAAPARGEGPTTRSPGLRQVATIVTPDTILRWYRRLIAQKWTAEYRRRPGRPGLMKEIAALIVRIASENPAWGYSRIQGALKNLDHCVARSTVAKVLKDNGIPPAPGRRGIPMRGLWLRRRGGSRMRW